MKVTPVGVVYWCNNEAIHWRPRCAELTLALISAWPGVLYFLRDYAVLEMLIYSLTR